MTNYKDLGIPKLLKLWHNIPDTVQVGIWVFISAGLPALGSYILNEPKLFKYYGIVNIGLFFVKELDKKRRK